MSGATEPVYLDHAATTRPFPAVVDAIAEAQLEVFGNPSSSHAFGHAAKKRLDDAREFLRGSLGAADLAFTSGGTEADLIGVVGAAATRPPGRVLAARDDHAAVLALGPLLAARRHELTLVPVTEHGDIHPEDLFELLGRDVRVVSILHGHNELGTLSDLGELVEVVRRTAPECHVHVDLVQAYGKVDFDMDLAGVDSVAVSGHKFHGPRGAGFLALSSKTRIAPIQAGGGQNHGLRGGTENVAGAIGMAVAAERMLSHLAENATHMASLGERMLGRVREAFPDVERLGHPERTLPHILSMRVPGIVGETLLERCVARGLAFSTGSACHGNESGGENHVLSAIGMTRREAREVIRLSFAAETTVEEVDRAAEILCAEADRLDVVAPAKVGRERSRRERTGSRT